MAITLSDIFIPKGSWRVRRGFAAHGKYGIPGIDYAIVNDTRLVNAFYDDGVVDGVGTNPKGKDWGNYCWIKNIKDPRYRLAYAHCRRFIVKKGQRVKSGQLIGYSDNSGNSTGPHLHFAVTFNDKPIDPAKLPWKVRNIKTPYTPPKPKIVEPWYKKDIRAKAAEIANLKKAVKSKATEISNLKKSIKQIEKTHGIEIEQMKTEYTKCRGRGTKLVGEIDTLKIKVQNLKAEITTFKEPTTVKIPRVTKTDGKWGRFWKPIFRFLFTYKTKK